MKKLSSSETELKKKVLVIKKACNEFRNKNFID